MCVCVCMPTRNSVLHVVSSIYYSPSSAVCLPPPSSSTGAISSIFPNIFYCETFIHGMETTEEKTWQINYCNFSFPQINPCFSSPPSRKRLSVPFWVAFFILSSYSICSHNVPPYLLALRTRAKKCCWLRRCEMNLSVKNFYGFADDEILCI